MARFDEMINRWVLYCLMFSRHPNTLRLGLRFPGFERFPMTSEIRRDILRAMSKSGRTD